MLSFLHYPIFCFGSFRIYGFTLRDNKYKNENKTTHTPVCMTKILLPINNIDENNDYANTKLLKTDICTRHKFDTGVCKSVEKKIVSTFLFDIQRRIRYNKTSFFVKKIHQTKSHLQRYLGC